MLSTQQDSSQSARPVAVIPALLAGMVIIGFSGILVRLSDAPGPVNALYRMAIGALLTSVPAWRRLRRREAGRAASLRQGAPWAFLAGLCFALDLIAWTTGVQLSGAGAPTLLGNTAPIWVGLGAYFLLGERPRPLFWLGLVVALLGAGVVLGQEFARSAELGLGASLGLIAATFYAAYYLVTQVGRARLDALTYVWLSSGFAALVLLVYNTAVGAPFTGYSAHTYAVFLAQGALVQVAGWLLITYAQGYVRAALVAPTLLGQPVITAVAAALLLGEQFTAWHVAGGIIVLGGVLLVHRSRSPQPTSRLHNSRA